MQIAVAIEIERPPSDVWPWLEEPEKQKQWMKGLVSNELVDGTQESAVGKKFVMKIKEGRKVYDYEGEITAFDKPKQMAITLAGGCMPGAMAVNYDLVDLDGRTRVEYRCDADCKGVMVTLFGWLFKIAGKAMTRSFFKKLKTKVESA